MWRKSRRALSSLCLSVAGWWCGRVQESKEPVGENDSRQILMAGQHMCEPYAANEDEQTIAQVPPQSDVVNGGKNQIADNDSGIEVDGIRCCQG